MSEEEQQQQAQPSQQQNGQQSQPQQPSQQQQSPQSLQQQSPQQQAQHQKTVTEYLAQLLKDKKQLDAFPNVFLHLDRILDEEISRIRINLFQLGGKESVCLPEPIGQSGTQTEKLYVPVKDHPEFNFVGRILGPRGMTAKQLEQETGCKIMVRGKGSMRDKAKEEQMKGKPNWEHLNDELHVLITCEDTKNRAEVKLKRAVEEIKRLLVPAPEGEDELKKKQLMELAIINGTYRDSSKLQQKMNQILIPGDNGSLAAAAAAVYGAGNLRSPPNPLGGQPLIISPRLLSANGGAASGVVQSGNQQQNQAQTLTNYAQQFSAANGAASAVGNHQQQQSQQPQMHHQHQQHHQLAAAAYAAQAQAQTQQDPSTGLFYTTVPTLYSPEQAAAFNMAATSQTLLEYPNGLEFSQAGSIKPQRFPTVGTPQGTPSMRPHPYARVALS